MNNEHIDDNYDYTIIKGQKESSKIKIVFWSKRKAIKMHTLTLGSHSIVRYMQEVANDKGHIAK